MANDIVESNMTQSVASANLQQNEKFTPVSGEVVVPIGTTEDGNTFVQDLGQIPHILVCGFTGSGKTSFVQAVTTNIATKYAPEKVKFIIFDTKRVDYTAFKEMPHLLLPVESDSNRATGIISWLSAEGKNRFKMFADTATKDIVSYNKQCEENGNETLPYIFAILDDFSSLQLSNDITSPLIDVLKNGRVVGIHLIIVTSLTSSKILQKDILSNVPCRIAFCVSTRADSRVAIEQNGAETLSVPGELIFRYQNQLVKCQGVYIPDEEVDKAIKKLQHQSRKNISALGNMAANIFDDSASSQQDKTTVTDFDEDPMLPYAVDAVLEAGQASTSLIQRKLKIGYARAARIIDLMEQLGIVSPYEGSMPRKVLITRGQWQTMRYGDDIPSPAKVVETHNPSVGATAFIPVKTDEEEPPDIKMRNFAQFSFNGIGVCIRDNQIRISNKVMTRLGPGKTTVSFNGKSVAGLTYKKPHLFSRGYIQFRMKPKVNIINNYSDLITVTRDNISNLLKIEFSGDVARTMKSFMVQISEDIGVSLDLL